MLCLIVIIPVLDAMSDGDKALGALLALFAYPLALIGGLIDRLFHYVWQHREPDPGTGS